MKRFLLVYILVIVLSTGIVVSEPNSTRLNEDSFCQNPIEFNAGLAIPDLKSYTKVKRYLFRDEWVYPYIRESHRQQIDWKDVKLIGDVFPQMKGPGVGTAFYNYNMSEAYLMPANNDTHFIRYKVEQSSNEPTFTFVGHKHKRSVPNEYIYWTIMTKTLDGKESNSDMIFVDITALDPEASGPSKDYGTKNYGKHNNKFVFAYNKATQGIDKRMQLNKEIFPNTIILINNLYQFVRIPIEFDGYYQTMNMETIFFKDTYACVLLSDTIDKFTETHYCQTWVDTRTIVGCTVDIFSETKTGPEVNPNEPKEDIASDL